MSQIKSHITYIMISRREYLKPTDYRSAFPLHPNSIRKSSLTELMGFNTHLMIVWKWLTFWGPACIWRSWIRDVDHLESYLIEERKHFLPVFIDEVHAVDLEEGVWSTAAKCCMNLCQYFNGIAARLLILHLQSDQKNLAQFYKPYSFIKYWPIFKLISLSESEIHL